MSSATASSSPARIRGNKRAHKAKSGRPFRQPCPRPQHSEVVGRLHRQGLPSPSSSPGTLLERIGGSMKETGRNVFQANVDVRADLPVSAPHVYTPEPGEVERFLESVIRAPPAPLEPSRPAHARSRPKPALALETHNLQVNRLVGAEDPSGSALYSPTQTVVNSQPSARLAFDRYCPQSPPPGDTMDQLSASAIEECRKHLVPVLVASARANGAEKRMDVEQPHGLLSDDHCRVFFRQAKEMRLQLSSRASQGMPVAQDCSRPLKRDRADEVGAWVRDTRSRLNPVVSDASRRDSDITLVDFTAGDGLPPRAPRAMLQASQAGLHRHPDSAYDGAPDDNVPQVASPMTIPSTERAHQQTSQSWPVTEMDTSGMSAGDDPNQAVPPTDEPAPPSSTDFVSHLPTQPGIWFRQLGKRYAEIVDVDIQVSDEMFYLSGERQPSRVRMHLRLCSVPVAAASEPDTNAPPQDVDDSVIARHAFHWPRKGRLVVQVNPGSEWSKTWLPHTLESDPLDVTSSVRPGKNTFRFIQLSDLSEYTFVLVASPPPPEEEWRTWDWASLVERSHSPAGDPTNDLSEFAHLSVIVR